MVALLAIVFVGTAGSIIIQHFVSGPNYICPDLVISADSYARSYLIYVNFTGAWNASVSESKSFSVSGAALACHYQSFGVRVLVFPNVNPDGESSVQIVAQKMDSGDGVMNVSITYGAAVRSNSTSIPFGTTLVYEGVAP